MMERYTPQAQEALGLAVGVAETLNHGYVGTEHLLIGLLQEGTGVAAKVLEENGVEEDLSLIHICVKGGAPDPHFLVVELGRCLCNQFHDLLLGLPQGSLVGYLIKTSIVVDVYKRQALMYRNP